MAEPNEPGSKAPGTPQQTPGNPNPDPGNQDPTAAGDPSQSVTREEFTRLERSINSVAAALRRQQAAAQAASPPAPASRNQAAPEDVKAEVAKIRSEIEADRNKVRMEKRSLAIRQAIASHGLDPDSSDMLEALIEKRHGSQLKVDDQGVFFEGELQERLPVKSVVDQLLDSKLGERLRPAKDLPHGRGLRGSNARLPAGVRRYSEIPQSERDKMTPAEREAALRAGQNAQ